MIELVCAFLMTDTDAVLRYEVVNRGREIYFLANAVRDYRFKQYSDGAYASVSADGKRLNLLLDTSPFPPDIEVEFAVLALYRELPPAGKISGEVRLSLPVVEWDAYHLPSIDYASDLVSVTQVALHVSAIAKSNVISSTKVPAAPGYLQIVAELNRASCVLNTDASLMVRKRREKFARE